MNRCLGLILCAGVACSGCKTAERSDPDEAVTVREAPWTMVGYLDFWGNYASVDVTLDRRTAPARFLRLVVPDTCMPIEIGDAMARGRMDRDSVVGKIGLKGPLPGRSTPRDFVFEIDSGHRVEVTSLNLTLMSERPANPDSPSGACRCHVFAQ